MAVVPEKPHVAVPGIPGNQGFGIEPDDAPASLPHFFQHIPPGIHIVGTAVADDDQGGAPGQRRKMIFPEAQKGFPVIRGDFRFQAGVGKNSVNGGVDVVILEQIGNFGHSAGTRLDTRPLDQVAEENRDRTHYPIPINTVYAIEYCCFYNIPEWDNQQVRISFEDVAALTKDGCHFIDGHQEEFYLIK